MIFFTKNTNLKNVFFLKQNKRIFFRGGGGGGGGEEGAGVREFLLLRVKI